MASTTVPSSDLPPNQTLYINNINERIKLPELKKQLYNLFSQFGPVIDIVAKRSLQMKGQAFIVFKDITTSTSALKKMHGFDFHGKPLKISYAKQKSDIIAQAEGTLELQKKNREEEKKKRKSAAPLEDARKKKRVKLEDGSSTNSTTTTTTQSAMMDSNVQVEPNRILFVQNLPIQNNVEQILNILFSNYDGLKEVRVVPGKPIAFVEYENEELATNAMMRAQGFKIEKQPILIQFAKR